MEIARGGRSILIIKERSHALNLNRFSPRLIRLRRRLVRTICPTPRERKQGRVTSDHNASG